VEVDAKLTGAKLILCLDSGSSSLKFSLYRMADGSEALCARGAVEGIGQPHGRLWMTGAQQQPLADERRQFGEHESSVTAAFDALDRAKLGPPGAVGHRLVHGGPDHLAPERVTPALIDQLRRITSFAPLHLPAEIRVIEAAVARYPAVPQVVCFDTSFHRRMPEVAQRFALPRELFDEGVRRYGFHGLSYEYVMGQLGTSAAGRVIIAHLGNGASMAAIRAGHPLDTTMGLTPTGGLMMGTRPGDLDPGVMLYLLNAKHLDAAELKAVVNQRSGLLGVSGTSSDMKALLDQRASDPRAAEAVDMFCYVARKHIGALAAVLGGLDTLVFTGGIGERAAPVREAICGGLEHLGIHIDLARNRRHADPISIDGNNCTVRVIATDEDLMIARHTSRLLSTDKNS
jgi:acetate kinase